MEPHVYGQLWDREQWNLTNTVSYGAGNSGTSRIRSAMGLGTSISNIEMTVLQGNLQPGLELVTVMYYINASTHYSLKCDGG